MRNSLSYFEIDVEAESCKFVTSDPMLNVATYQILSKDDKIFVKSCQVPILLK